MGKEMALVQDRSFVLFFFYFIFIIFIIFHVLKNIKTESGFKI